MVCRRLDAQKKQMIIEKEKLLSENKKAESGLDGLVGELDGLSKVRCTFLDSVRLTQRLYRSPLSCKPRWPHWNSHSRVFKIIILSRCGLKSRAE